jgi:hypothetical protein
MRCIPQKIGIRHSEFITGGNGHCSTYVQSLSIIKMMPRIWNAAVILQCAHRIKTSETHSVLPISCDHNFKRIRIKDATDTSHELHLLLIWKIRYIPFEQIDLWQK